MSRNCGNRTVTVAYDEIKHDTGDGGATLLRIDDREIWVPNSLITERDEARNEMEIVEWFAIKEELE